MRVFSRCLCVSFVIALFLTLQSTTSAVPQHPLEYHGKIAALTEATKDANHHHEGWASLYDTHQDEENFDNYVTQHPHHLDQLLQIESELRKELYPESAHQETSTSTGTHQHDTAHHNVQPEHDLSSFLPIYRETPSISSFDFSDYFVSFPEDQAEQSSISETPSHPISRSNPPMERAKSTFSRPSLSIQELSQRPLRYNLVEWQRKLTRSEIDQIYQTIEDVWGPRLPKRTRTTAFKRIRATLNDETADKILHGDLQTINDVAQRTGPYKRFKKPNEILEHLEQGAAQPTPSSNDKTQHQIGESSHQIQQTDQTPLESPFVYPLDVDTRLDIYRKFEWQRRLPIYDILRLYKIISQKWGQEISTKTKYKAILRLKVFLDREPQLVQRILDNDENAINKAAFECAPFRRRQTDDNLVSSRPSIRPQPARSRTRPTQR